MHHVFRRRVGAVSRYGYADIADLFAVATIHARKKSCKRRFADFPWPLIEVMDDIGRQEFEKRWAIAVIERAIIAGDEGFGGLGGCQFGAGRHGGRDARRLAFGHKSACQMGGWCGQRLHAPAAHH